jgi:hypothetical protein
LSILADLGGWIIHRPAHSDLLRAAQMHRRQLVSWWDALILVSAIELGWRPERPPQAEGLPHNLPLTTAL